MLVVELTASLDHPAPTLERARREAAAGDSSWGRWVSEYERGEAVIVRLDVRLLVGDDGQAEVIEVSNRGVFLEKAVHLPTLEQQVAEMTNKDSAELAAKLRERGHAIDTFDLASMYVHVELDPDLRRTVLGGPTPGHVPAAPPAGEVALSFSVDPAGGP